MTEYVRLRSTLSQTQVCPLDHDRGIQKRGKMLLVNKAGKNLVR